MNNPKTIRRLWCFRDMQFAEAEAWLTDMARQGWRLDYLSTVSARFVRCEPGSIEYRCMFNYYETYALRDQWINENKKAGWECIFNNDRLIVFYRQDSVGSDYLLYDPIQLKERLMQAKRNSIVVTLLVAVLFLAALTFAIWELLVQQTSLRLVLSSSLLVIVFAAILLDQLNLIRSITLSLGSIKNGSLPIVERSIYRKIRVTRITFNALSISLAVFALLYDFIELLGL